MRNVSAGFAKLSCFELVLGERRVVIQNTPHCLQVAKMGTLHNLHKRNGNGEFGVLQTLKDLTGTYSKHTTVIKGEMYAVH
jgi:hypothetical protein